MSTPTRLAIVDDHAMLLESLVEWIGSYAPDFEVVAAATSWPALVHSPNFPPELVLMDFQLGDAISIEARIRSCRAAGSDVVVFSGGFGGEYRDRALAAGARAFVSKTVPMESLMDSSRAAIGRAAESASPAASDPEPVEQPRPKLSRGEREALLLYIGGLSTAEVAERLQVQYETAKTFLRRVRQKYAAVGRPASRRADLEARAREDGLAGE